MRRKGESGMPNDLENASQGRLFLAGDQVSANTVTADCVTLEKKN